MNSRHVTVLLNEAIGALNVRPDGVYVDCTFGQGGHSRAILGKLSANGRLIALDRDMAAVAAGRAVIDARFCVAHSNFGRLREVLRELNVSQVDGVLLDLGVSATQLQEAARGFSFRFDGPLDMRMDTSHGKTAAQWLASASEKEIGEVIKNYGEERFAKQIARKIIAARAWGPVNTTRQLAQIVAKAVRTREPGQDPATRTFQALRIHINQELEELSIVLPRAVDLLRPLGRLVVISFHSLEDRMVKRFMRAMAKPESLPEKLPVRATDAAQPKLRLVGKPIKPSEEEIRANPRARSAVMRIAERIETTRNRSAAGLGDVGGKCHR
ncbi:MAG TPA: 16S rRNA (cytosine(1402)-N(4))-methyltransferase RsmH [Burkholderiales bacterium]|nr:16S rRNA (cytosine(1402)-N(4))-methyltransferase RsmH [Burkholderiales bacterium]